LLAVGASTAGRGLGNPGRRAPATARGEPPLLLAGADGGGDSLPAHFNVYCACVWSVTLVANELYKDVRKLRHGGSSWAHAR
jgi:hypothetical protein